MSFPPDSPLAQALKNMARSDANIVLRMPEEHKQWLLQLAAQRGMSISDYVKYAINHFIWSQSPIELKQVHTNDDPEFIDLMNTAPYPILLASYMLADHTFDPTGHISNKHRHTCHFSPFVRDFISGETKPAILDPGRTVRVYTSRQQHLPHAAPNVQVWTSLDMESPIWNRDYDRIVIYRITRQDSEPIFKGPNASAMMALLRAFTDAAP